MTSRARIALTALGLTLGILVLFVGTVWVLMATVSEDGLPTGGAKVAVVEIEGIILDGGQAVRDLREHGDNPSVKAVVVRINSPGGVVAPTQEIFSAIQRLRKGIAKTRASDIQFVSERPQRVADAARRRRFLVQDDQHRQQRIGG